MAEPDPYERRESFLDDLREDLARYRADPGAGGLRATLDAALAYGFLATAIYRFGRLCRRIRPWPLSIPAKLLYHLLRLFSELGMGIYISTNSRIGPGLHIGHFGGVYLSCDIGRRCTLAQGVTIGYKGAGRSTRPPRIGDDVYVGAGAMIVGDVSVGDGCIVGANTTVTKDVPARHRVVSAAVRMSPIEPIGAPAPASAAAARDATEPAAAP